MLSYTICYVALYLRLFSAPQYKEYQRSDKLVLPLKNGKNTQFGIFPLEQHITNGLRGIV